MPLLDGQRWYELQPGVENASRRRPALFLDRDGVIIAEKIYLGDPQKVELLAGVAEKLGECKRLQIPVVVVTNQSGIARGFFDWEQYELVHRRMVYLCGGANPFAAVYANAHLPGNIESSWRKPGSGMLERAAEDLSLCLDSSVMVGDKAVDLEAGQRAGIPNLVHVRTGHGEAERAGVIARYPEVICIESLADLDLKRFSALTDGLCDASAP